MANHLALQPGEDKLHAKDHEQNTDKQQGLVVDRLVDEEIAFDDNIDVY